ANLRAVESYYLIIDECPGVDVVRLYWAREQDRSGAEPIDTIWPSESHRPHLASFGVLNRTIGPDDDQAVLEFQVARGASLVGATFLAVLLAVVSGFVVFTAPSEGNLVAILQVFALVPGGLIALIALYGSRFAASLALPLKIGALVVGGLSALLAVVLGFL